MNTRPPPPTRFEKLLTVSKAIWDNLPDFTDKTFTAESVNALVPKLEALLAADKMSEDWIDSVYQAQSNGWPVHIDFNNELWAFHTIQDRTKSRDYLIQELAKVGREVARGNVTFKDKDGRTLNRAERRRRK